ncbi:MAG: hypothetical protein FWB80_08020 [Defluviitaleaceae bacterium]|nr:hypothetical protein [Defluviitaleaceae bacterium]
MKILYDFQENFKDIEAGDFETNEIVTSRNEFTMALLNDIEDVKSLLLTKRTRRESGVLIHLKKIPNLQPGDRIIITGRVSGGDSNPRNGWSVALLSTIDGHITQHIAPSSVFSLSHMLEEKELDQTMVVHTIGWGASQPLMDFCIDGILITRNDRAANPNEDTRTSLYSTSDDPQLKWISTNDVQSFGDTLILVRSGSPNVRMFKRKGVNAFHVGVRVNDWDGVDIRLSHLKLLSGNKYKITVHGKIDGDAPPKSVIMLQGIPSYTWCSSKDITPDMSFTLEHILTRSQVEGWTSARITTNTPGAKTSFYIYSIDVVRL